MRTNIDEIIKRSNHRVPINFNTENTEEAQSSQRKHPSGLNINSPGFIPGKMFDCGIVRGRMLFREQNLFDETGRIIN